MGLFVNLNGKKGFADADVSPAARWCPEKPGHRALLSRLWLFLVAFPCDGDSPQEVGWVSPCPRLGTRVSSEGRWVHGVDRLCRRRVPQTPPARPVDLVLSRAVQEPGPSVGTCEHRLQIQNECEAV